MIESGLKVKNNIKCNGQIDFDMIKFMKQKAS